MTDFITPARAQREFQFSKKFFYTLVKEGLELHKLRQHGRKKYVRRSDIERMMTPVSTNKAAEV